eukprot:8150072-Karenia_brevis.AAC.1
MIWAKSQWGLDHALNPWARVKGPMGAAQMHLSEMQWKVPWRHGTLRLTTIGIFGSQTPNM